MQHFPIFVSLAGKSVVLAGGGEAVLAKLRLLLKTEADITVFAPVANSAIAALAAEGRVTLIARDFAAGDAKGALLAYVATGDEAADVRVAALAQADGALVNIVDNLKDSAFITPAIVDRDPVVVAIGTEGAAPVLARAIKTKLEEDLSPLLGELARIGKDFRAVAEQLPLGRARRAFWAEYFETVGPRAFASGGEEAVLESLDDLLNRHLLAAPTPGRVDLVGAGPGDPELLTLKARAALDRADVVIHDRLVSPAILELARREAVLIDAGKEGFGPSAPQSDINAQMVRHAMTGNHVVRLKAGDPVVFARLDEEIEALDGAGIDWTIVPGITAASAAVAAIGQSLTRRGRNGSVRFLTGHDVAGFADQDWRGLAGTGEVAAIYMGKRAARFLQGRLMMHGAAHDTPVSVVENASLPDQRIIGTTLRALPESTAALEGPAVLLYGLAPRAASAALEELKEALS
ncbi:MAG: uroporphyrinogen-III C-methyltransferase [Paracoccaceae bacterium]|nr:uroporphyrinogen-III C-methyltransferase [Paracoccaceae bacterium]